MLRTIACWAALSLGLLASQNVSAAPACDDAPCPATAPSKPLDIRKFMREQAASTRVNSPPKANAAASVRVKRPAQPKVAARPKPAKLPVEAARSFASQPAPNVEVVSGDEVNSIDRAADVPRAETVGAAAADDRAVQMVDAEEYNHIDRQGERAQPASASPARDDNPSWLRRIWSAFGNLFTALSAAVHQLIG